MPELLIPTIQGGPMARTGSLRRWRSPLYMPVSSDHQRSLAWSNIRAEHAAA
jgi:hypothetical protein